MKHTFGGGQTTVYAEYIDAERQSTLVAEPGQSYEIAPARGHARELPVPPDDRWSAAKAPAKSTKEKD